MKQYNHTKIEQKWQKKWRDEKAGEAHKNTKKEKSYLLVEFPYPSGEGLHVGHVRSYTAMDIIARKRRAEGKEVLYPIGWDAFGLPTENYAVKTGEHPKAITKQNTDTFRRQLQSLGLSFDWGREINTTDPAYYKWTQWIFTRLFNQGLAYKAKMPINWCLSCKIGLANEEVVLGKCERCGGETEKREKEQWMLAITKYADRLDKDLDDMDYLERIKTQQKNWIGKSEGVEITFPLQATNSKPQTGIRVFTTRPDTLFGATYMVLAPEHELVKKLLEQTTNKDEIIQYIEATKSRTEIERTTEGREKTGVELKEIKAINPANKAEIPIWIADYVLAHYGTGAIMAVPAHDDRDFEFARKFHLPVREVVAEETGIKHDNEEFRDGCCAIIFDPKRQKYVVAKWPHILGLFSGGIDGEESRKESVLREVEEESGLYDFAYVEELINAFPHFYNKSKNINRFARATCFLLVLNSESRRPQKLEEHENFEVMWVTTSKILADWNTRGTEGRPEHWIKFLHHGVGRAIELGYDTTSNLKEFFPTPFMGEGILVNSGQFDGMSSEEAKKAITEFVGGEIQTTFKLRDWVFSRQRYWGEPIPLIFCESCVKKDTGDNKGEKRNPGWIAVPDEELPVELPKVETYTPTDTGESPLMAMHAWVKATCPRCGGEARRETDTMPNWAGSSWYFLRYVDPHNNIAFAEREKLDYWTPVDWYNGGMEHTTLHLLYSRFWHKFLYDEGLVPTSEPYQKRTSHGLILAEGGEKMSKSKGNVVNPDEITERFGADTLRLYEMFIGPFEQAVAWSTDGLMGPRRFLEKVWRLYERMSDTQGRSSNELESLLHQTIRKVTTDIEEMKFNTAVSQLMILANAMGNAQSIAKIHYTTFLRLLAPFAPHITEELWSLSGGTDSIHEEIWPRFNTARSVPPHYRLAVQIDGKTRGSFETATPLNKHSAEEQAKELPAVAARLRDKTIRRVIYVENRLINFVLSGE